MVNEQESSDDHTSRVHLYLETLGPGEREREGCIILCEMLIHVLYLV